MNIELDGLYPGPQFSSGVQALHRTICVALSEFRSRPVDAIKVGYMPMDAIAALLAAHLYQIGMRYTDHFGTDGGTLQARTQATIGLLAETELMIGRRLQASLSTYIEIVRVLTAMLDEFHVQNVSATTDRRLVD